MKPRSAVRTESGLIGFVTTFFDTLGIGNFATTTSAFKIFDVVPDELIPGTLNVGFALPTIAQAIIYMTVVDVDTTTLWSMIGGAVAGAWLGAGVVARLDRKAIQIGMGIALLVAGAIMLLGQVGLLPVGGAALGVRGLKLVAASSGNFVLGALMTLGIGLYAPCMILVSLLGLDPTAAFPIMMGSCAALMPVASARFISTAAYSPAAAIGLNVGGLPAVAIAAFIVRSLPLNQVRWLVIAVVGYAAFRMLTAVTAEPPAKVAAERTRPANSNV